MVAFKSMLYSNLKRRIADGFAVGYNIIFPLLLIWILGFLCKGMFEKELLTSYQYYGVVIIPFSLFMAIVTAAYSGKDDAYADTADRVLIAPISITTIVVPKILAEIVVFTGCSLLVFGFSSVLWKVWSLGDIIPIGILFASISFMIASVGTYMGLGMKNFMRIKNILNVPIVLFAILAGCFFRFGTFHKGLQVLINLSPLTWVNRGIFMMIYDDNITILYTVCAVFTLIGFMFTMLSIVCFKKEEYGYGKLSGYEK